MSAPVILRSLVVAKCACGEEHELEDVHDGWQQLVLCECGRRLSVQFDNPILQYDTSQES